MRDRLDPFFIAFRVSVGEDKVGAPLRGVGCSQIPGFPIICQIFDFGLDRQAYIRAEPHIKEYGFVRAHGYGVRCSDFIIVGIVTNARCACGFIFRKFYGRRHSEIVDSVCGNLEAETGIARTCNAFSVSIIDINIAFRFVSTFITLNLDDFVGLVFADGEIAILPYVLPYLFCQRHSSCNRVIAGTWYQFPANIQFQYIRPIPRCLHIS
ncbi:unknown [Firmicutes bacterium CAG:124]|nr:unknown [Firmicutes bacterium CAG:124]